ncbi:MAG: tetratricopeptide repeat protein [Verrucomicrobia bacterium]|nr:tetratricopeptide repeat protein [Verrucomicrobiota bacterium]
MSSRAAPSLPKSRLPPVTPARSLLLAGGFLTFAVVAAYHRVLPFPLYFDDVPAIVENETIRHLGRLDKVLSPPLNGSAVTGRPLINLSFALNHALGGTAPAGYHAVNLALHAASTLLLFGLVRRSLRLPALVARFGRDSTTLALATALLWAVHPLQTESVTCIAQRTELLVGLFYLLTLYALVRGVAGERPGPWPALGVAACFLGMASKEVMVSAPLLVLVYDRAFVAGSFRAAWLARRHFYLGLAASWLLLVALLVATGGARGAAAGFGLGVTGWSYLLKQCEAIVHYVRLAFWPSPLVVDYGADVVGGPAAVLPQALALLVIFGLTLVGLWKNARLAFVGLWFFAILAPSSSVVPLVAQTMAEHRMYLPLAALVTLAVLGCYAAAGKRGLLLPLGVAFAFGGLTLRRNDDYRSEISLWSVTATQRPFNPRAHANLGAALLKTGAVAEAVRHLAEAVRLKSDYADASQNLATGLLLLGRVDDAIAEFHRLLALTPSSGEAHSNLGLALLQAGRTAEALVHGRAAVRLLPDAANTRYNFAVTLAATGHPAEAVREFEAVLRLEPAHGMAHFGLGRALLTLSRQPEALTHLERAVRLLPGFAPAREALAAALPGPRT